MQMQVVGIRSVLYGMSISAAFLQKKTLYLLSKSGLFRLLEKSNSIQIVLILSQYGNMLNYEVK